MCFAYSCCYFGHFIGSCSKRIIPLWSSQTRLTVCQCYYIALTAPFRHRNPARASRLLIVPPSTLYVFVLFLHKKIKKVSFMTQQILCNINITGGKMVHLCLEFRLFNTHFILNWIHYSLHLHPSKKHKQGHLIWFGSVSQSLFQFYGLRQQNKESLRKKRVMFRSCE